MIEEKFSITNETKGKLPSLPFVFIKDDILGKTYTLSLAFVSPAKSHALNLKWRGKDKPTNILSFSLTKNSGEIVLCPELIKKESRDPEKNFGKNFTDLLQFLVIHGMLHLKGMEHSSRMERAEKKYDQKYLNWNRPRVSDHTSGSGRIRKRGKKS